MEENPKTFTRRIKPVNNYLKLFLNEIIKQTLKTVIKGIVNYIQKKFSKFEG